MKILFILGTLFCLVPASACARTVTVAQCRSALKDFTAIHTDEDVKRLTASMTSGDEMQLSTSLAACIAQHSDVLTSAEVARLNLFVYKLDADVMARMWAFIEKRHLADAFNDEQEATKAK
jgi:hypothetical protein